MATNQLPDALLVRRYIDGDETALSTLVKRHESKISQTRKLGHLTEKLDFGNTRKNIKFEK